MIVTDRKKKHILSANYILILYLSVAVMWMNSKREKFVAENLFPLINYQLQF